MSYIVSIYFPPQTATLAAVMLALVATMFSGSYPRLPELQQMSPFIMFVSNSSYARWSQEILFLSEMKSENYSSYLDFVGTNVSTVGASLIGYEPVAPEENIQYGITQLCNLGFQFRLVAFVLMVCCNRSKKK